MPTHMLLQNESVKYQNECYLLLSVIAGKGVAGNIIEQQPDLYRHDETLEKKLAKYLGKSGQACKDTIGLIEQQLKKVEDESERFAQVLVGSSDDASAKNRTHRQQVRLKLKFSFSQTRLESNVEKLRTLNETFMTFSQQLVRLKNSSPGVISTENQSHHTEDTFNRRHVVHTAALLLHQALQKACNLHSDHAAHLSTEIEHVDGTRAVIRFNMAFQNVSSNNLALTTEAPYWFAVDSFMSEGIKRTNSGTERLPPDGKVIPMSLTQSLSRAISSTSEAFTSIERVNLLSLSQSGPSTISSLPISCPLPNICTRRNLCYQMRTWREQNPDGQSQYVGLLGETANCEHRIRLSDAQAGAKDRMKPMRSLAQMSYPFSTGTSMLQWERLRLARQLAVAILNFHATPWLEDSWLSEDIVLYGLDDDRSSISVPHLCARVEGPKRVSPSSPACSKKWARNPLLYGLGVVLLELALESSLSTLKQPIDMFDDGNNGMVEFLAARRLSNTVGRGLGKRYGDIVRKCLECDFGCGDNLNDPTLQDAFHREVICPLERLERGFRDLQIGD
ncbi:MAG: hypothetical protein M4579_003108 [Chaenotheca gracillima]|nr:MAG: hypothetical protein M4579_003108 [Chaenotheca gracillima]